MQPAAVADAGGLLVLAGLLEGIDHEVDEVLVLDATSLLVAEYLALRHEGAPHRARAEFGLVNRVVSEWFPVRAVAIEAAITVIGQDDIDGVAALELAETLDVPIITKNRDLSSRNIAVLYC
ncbi:MAG TPA: hypothetical protein VGJ03_04140 [Acidimicrobiales bacterium]